MSRNWSSHEAEAGEFTVRVLHWNVLAQALTDGFDKTPEECLPWDYRKQLFAQEFNKKRDDGTPFWDIIVTAECDKHDEFFSGNDNWVGHYGLKPGSFTGGCSVFANPEKFEVVKVHCEHFKEEDGSNMSQNWVGLELKHKATGSEFVCIGTHLKAKPPMAPMRKVQATQMVACLE